LPRECRIQSASERFVPTQKTHQRLRNRPNSREFGYGKRRAEFPDDVGRYGIGIYSDHPQGLLDPVSRSRSPATGSKRRQDKQAAAGQIMALQNLWVSAPISGSWRRHSAPLRPTARAEAVNNLAQARCEPLDSPCSLDGGSEPVPLSRSRAASALRLDLRAIVGDGAAYSVMVGIGETYLPAFVLALGLGGIAAGMIATVPVLLGALLQLVSPWAVRRLGSRRSWIVWCARCQATSLMLLAVLALLEVRQSWPIFLLATLYWGAGLATGPAWNTWVESIVPRRIRARFFAGRVRISQASTLTGLLLGGLLLNALNVASVVQIFCLLFGVAAIARLVSASYLARQSEPPDAETGERELGLLATFSSLRRNASTRVLVYLLAVQVAVYTSGPYFSPYMLSELGISYLQFVMLIGLAFLGKMIALPVWGRFAMRFGVRRLLWVGGTGIVPIGGLWCLSDSLFYLGALQIVSGIVWAAYELAMVLLFFDGLPKSQRTSLLTLYNVGSAAAMVGGGLLGAALLAWLGPTHGAYLTLFAVSSLARVGTLVLLAGVPDMAGQPAVPATRTVAVRASNGSVEQPILATVEE
jgi:MFS family permease